ncbi:hypothetical protein Tco_0969471 [Tanacetum coccineum]
MTLPSLVPFHMPDRGRWSSHVGDESYDSYFAERDVSLQSLARRAKCFPWYTVTCMDATSNSIISTDVRNAFSLLSTSSWPSNWHEESSSFDQFANRNNNISLEQAWNVTGTAKYNQQQSPP